MSNSLLAKAPAREDFRSSELRRDPHFFPIYVARIPGGSIRRGEPLTPGDHKHAEIRSDIREAKSKKGGDGGVAAIIEGKNDKLIYRNEGGDRGGDRFRHVHRGCHGPRVTKSGFSRIPLTRRHGGKVRTFEKTVDRVTLKVVAEIKGSDCWLMTAYELG